MTVQRPIILLTGGTGQVGWELARALAPLGRVVTPGRAALDLADEPSIRRTVRDTRPALIVNAAAHTAVDRAESEPALAHAINAEAPRVLAEEAARTGALVVHYSTDYVFDGSAGSPYLESAPPAPINTYGETKLAGERAMEHVGAPHLIFRTSWVYGRRGANFLRTMLRLAREREELRIVADQRGAPTWSRMIAEATALVLAQCRAAGGFALPADAGGIYHLTAGGETTWCDFARAILAADPARQEHRCRAVVPIATEAYPTPARRPRYSVLDNARLERDFGVRLPGWEQQLTLAMAG